MKRYTLLLGCVLLPLLAMAHAFGVVLDEQGEPLIGASVYWENTTIGVATDIDGRFELEPVRSTHNLVVSYMGYHNDTIQVRGEKELVIVLVSNLELDEVVIMERKMAVIKSRTEAFNTHTLSGEELCKAACCNLSESFETNASVDVAYADAATGAKQIRLLGLSGTYVQLLIENAPGIRGLATNYGMEYIPGSWMSAIQVSKGTSSVINGYEATTGQINVEYLKPQTQDPIAVNVMMNTMLHTEVNVTGGWMVTQHDDDEEEEHEHEHGEECHHHHGLKVSTGILAHYQNGAMMMDDNGDGFMDKPMGNQANLLNRWYIKKDDYGCQILLRGIYDQRDGGQMGRSSKVQGFQSSKSPQVSTLMDSETSGTMQLLNPYHIALRTYRIDGFMKNGYVFDHESGMSIGIITAASYHNQQYQYGLREWNAAQTNAYLNAIFQTNFGDDHKLSAGLSVNYDKYNESLSVPVFHSSKVLNSQVMDSGTLEPLNPETSIFDRAELTPGIFAEYTFKHEENLSFILGLRGDYSTKYGFFATPRFNIRYSPWDWWVLRGSVGLGYRSPNVLADNALFMASSRVPYYKDESGVKTLLVNQKDLKQERAMNAGLSTTFYIPAGSREIQLSGEYYYTHFMQSVLMDMETAGEIVFSNMGTGDRSFAQSWQVEASTEILRGWTMTLAFRQTDVRQTIGGKLRDKALNHGFKGIITTSYQTPLKKWQFDFTAQFNGGGRMPDSFKDFLSPQSSPSTLSNSKQYYIDNQGDIRYRWYPQLMAQVTKYWRTCSLYVGAENMTNFKQDSPIIGALGTDGQPQDNLPTNPAFDASMAWGPISGWEIYLGFRWSLDRKED